MLDEAKLADAIELDYAFAGAAWGGGLTPGRTPLMTPGRASPSALMSPSQEAPSTTPSSSPRRVTSCSPQEGQPGYRGMLLVWWV